jgi:hypothetical protein
MAAAMALSAGAAIAQTGASGQQRYYAPYERGFWNYAGVSVGRSDYDTSCRAGFGCDSRDTGFKAFAGGKFNQNLGLEGSYVYLGDSNRAGGNTWAQGVDLSLVGYLPLSQSFAVNAKVGGIYGWTKTGGASAPGFATGRDNGLGLSYGVGASYALTRTVDLRLDWDRYRMKFTTGRDDVDLASLGVAFKF